MTIELHDYNDYLIAAIYKTFYKGFQTDSNSIKSRI